MDNIEFIRRICNFFKTHDLNHDFVKINIYQVVEILNKTFDLIGCKYPTEDRKLLKLITYTMAYLVNINDIMNNNFELNLAEEKVLIAVRKKEMDLPS